MLRELGNDDREAIQQLVYAHERKSLFIISSLAQSDAFSQNRYFGWEESGKLRGVAASFGLWGSLVVVSDAEDVLRSLVDRVVSAGVAISSVPGFRRFAEPTVAQLREHGIAPRSQEPSFVYELTQERFRSVPTIARTPAPDQIDDLVHLQRSLHAKNDDLPVTSRERRQMEIVRTYVCVVDGTIVSKAAVHGRSRHYAQIGGVITHPAFRGRGFAKQCVSALCADCFASGMKNVLLFTAKGNLPAQRVYESLGFVITDDYLLTEYPERAI
jgi:uncharacterized protein